MSDPGSTTTSPPPRRPLHRRVLSPRIRQNGRLIFSSLATLALVGVLVGTVQITPIVFSSEVLEVPEISHDVRGEVDLFDREAAHTVAIEISDVEYAKMKADYVAGGDKTWIRADVVIDGTRLESVGIRLKGNSTLMSLRGDRGGPMGPGGAGGAPPPGTSAVAPGAMPPGAAPPPAGMAPPAGSPPSGEAAPPNGGPTTGGEPRGGGPAMSNVSFDDPSTLPLLLRFDKFVKGRGYQGRAELALRPVVGASGATLNEAVALQLIAESGQPTQKYTWIRFTMNGREARTRLLIENPDQNFAQSLGKGQGALFKAKATGSFAYKGEDATAYADDFDQISARGSLDLEPLLRLMQFVDTATDEAFDRDLARHVDVDALGRYVATHELLGNFDDMSGPGKNYLLWYDGGDQRFTVITWDMNLAITGMGGGMGGSPGAGGMPFPPAMGSAGGGPPGMAASAVPAAMGAPPGMGGPPGGAPGGAPGGGMRMGNPLKSRFLASEAMAITREAARQQLIDLWFTNGRAESVVRELAASVPTTATLSREAIDAEATTVAEKVRALGVSAVTPKPAAADAK